MAESYMLPLPLYIGHTLASFQSVGKEPLARLESYIRVMFGVMAVAKRLRIKPGSSSMPGLSLYFTEH